MWRGRSPWLSLHLDPACNPQPTPSTHTSFARKETLSNYHDRRSIISTANQPATTASPLRHAKQLSLSSSPTGVEQQIPNQPAGRTIYQIPKPSTTSLPQILPASQARDLPRFARLLGRKENWLAGLGDCGPAKPDLPLSKLRKMLWASFEFLDTLSLLTTDTR